MAWHGMAWHGMAKIACRNLHFIIVLPALFVCRSHRGTERRASSIASGGSSSAAAAASSSIIIEEGRGGEANLLNYFDRKHKSFRSMASHFFLWVISCKLSYIHFVSIVNRCSLTLIILYSTFSDFNRELPHGG